MSKGPKLTRKQETFVNTFIETGIGSVAARAAYDIEPTDTRLAAVMAAENLAKPNIKEAIGSRLTAEKVEKAHESLIEAVRLDYFVFVKSMPDEEIKAHLEAQGLTVINIRPSEKGKLAFYSLPDGPARGKGIELYHKIHGTFAPEKKLNVNVSVEANDRIKRLAAKLKERDERQ